MKEITKSEIIWDLNPFTEKEKRLFNKYFPKGIYAYFEYSRFLSFPMLLSLEMYADTNELPNGLYLTNGLIIYKLNNDYYILHGKTKPNNKEQVDIHFLFEELDLNEIKCKYENYIFK